LALIDCLSLHLFGNYLLEGGAEALQEQGSLHGQWGCGGFRKPNCFRVIFPPLLNELYLNPMEPVMEAHI
jgi:hypothetical protein